MNRAQIKERIAEINKQLGKALINFRMEKGFNREILASKMGISQQQLGKYEYATNQISIARLFLLTQTFGMNISYFLSGIEHSMPETQVNKFERIDLEIIKNLKRIKDQDSKQMISSLVKSLADKEEKI